MSERAYPKHLVLSLDPSDRAEIDRYMRFVEATDQCAHMGIAAHVASLIAFALELHEQFQQWVIEEGAQRTHNSELRSSTGIGR